jgi:hypothetical protein
MWLQDDFCWPNRKQNPLSITMSKWSSMIRIATYIIFLTKPCRGVGEPYLDTLSASRSFAAAIYVTSLKSNSNFHLISYCQWIVINLPAHLSLTTQ